MRLNIKFYLLCLALLSSIAYANQSNYEKLFIKNSINDLKQWALSAKKSNFVGDTYSADQIYADYTNNELAANKKYKKHPIRIKTTVSKIKEDVFGNAFIVSELKKATLGQAYFKVDEKDERVLALSKNDKVDLMCKFDEFTLDSLNFKDCLFTDQYLDKVLAPVSERLQSETSSNYKPKSQMEFALYTIKSAMPSTLLEKLCTQDLKNCSMDNMSKTKVFSKKEKEQIKQAVENMEKILKENEELMQDLPRFPNVE
ncbi:OB-fold putative lipoprotein [Avibacterium sp. 21-595]|uniref:OB-fold putative lipoprotein n=1 Tax=Avibacterium sp. 21-595 TaxID=2911527 RepID=UPI002026AAD5|nr:OB-fold putative lipoprotein [Avibacterium sp. 21-595]URL05933.1 OB-fold putative lipoprotein [Avibacterium sp. 21-595]